MLRKNVLALLLVVWLGLTLIFRHHLRDLVEVARTYSTFYPYISEHPETLLRYTTPHAQQDTDSKVVPQIIHQIFLTENWVESPLDLGDYADAVTSVQTLHPNWTHNIWIEENARSFMSSHYPEIFPHYVGYKQRIQRANILRYALLHHFGGVYLDLDITCLQTLDDLRHLPFMTPGAYPAGVNNAFILSRPGHSFLRHLLDAVPAADRKWGMPYVENMLTTGCMFFSNQWMSYARLLTSKSSATQEQDKTYILADEAGRLESHMLRGAVTTPLFKHGGASSWHGWDAAGIVFIGKHYFYFLTVMAVGVLGTILLVWRYFGKDSFRRRRGANLRLMGKHSMDKSARVRRDSWRV